MIIRKQLAKTESSLKRWKKLQNLTLILGKISILLDQRVLLAGKKAEVMEIAIFVQLWLDSWSFFSKFQLQYTIL
ncbi:unnamed protein product [Blepharisma stoltei]|uniref:Uncharacterized protein n=1 Tax=Blepharisma stoltei TaxID=1481888 RepID=A0AAU9KA91_9CILI|nr:unnamed protein product [Blepharisma stoltei]